MISNWPPMISPPPHLLSKYVYSIVSCLRATVWVLFSSGRPRYACTILWWSLNEEYCTVPTQPISKCLEFAAVYWDLFHIAAVSWVLFSHHFQVGLTRRRSLAPAAFDFHLPFVYFLGSSIMSGYHKTQHLKDLVVCSPNTVAFLRQTVARWYCGHTQYTKYPLH